jgi:hypothetical protein
MGVPVNGAAGPGPTSAASSGSSNIQSTGMSVYADASDLRGRSRSGEAGSGAPQPVNFPNRGDGSAQGGAQQLGIINFLWEEFRNDGGVVLISWKFKY